MNIAESLSFRRYYSHIEPILQKPQVKTYFSLIMFLLTISFFILFAIRPTAKTITSLLKQIEDAKYTNQELQKKINALSLAQIAYNSVTGDLPVIYNALPDNPSIPTLVKYIEGLAAASDISITNMQLTPIDLFNKEATMAATQSNLTEYNFSMVVSGSYKNLSSFTEIARKLQRLMVIKNLHITDLSNQGKTSVLSYEFSGVTFILK